MKYLQKIKEMHAYEKAEGQTLRTYYEILEKEFKQSCAAFEKSKDKLSEGVLRFFHFYHDTDIMSINVIYKESGVDIAVAMRHRAYCHDQNGKNTLQTRFEGKLMHRDVAEYRADIIAARFNMRSSYHITYNYGELFLDEDDLWVHNMLVHPVPNEINIKCKKIEWIDEPWFDG